MTDLVPRREAIRLLQADRRAIERAIATMSSRRLTTAGLGGGDWSPKDLVGHLESWEEHTLAALAAWAEGRGAPIDRALRERGTAAVNADEVARKTSRSLARTLSSASATHDELIRTLRAIDDQTWALPATPRQRRPLGARVGGLLAGPDLPFAHDRAHLPDLSAFSER
jgi:hypothetical protein